MKTPHRRLQRCTWPTSLPRFKLFWKIVRAGVHNQLWQKFFWKGMWKKQLPAISFSAIHPTQLLPRTLGHFGQLLIHRYPVPLEYPMPDSPLWGDGPQATRLAELTADTADPAKELPLRRDVRSLGILLGRVLVEQEGQDFFNVVEQLRQLLIEKREQPVPDPTSESGISLMARAHEIVSGLSIEDAY